MIEYTLPTFADTGETQAGRMFLTSIEREPHNTVPCNPLEGMILVRDPENAADPNAIAVKNVHETHVGYLPGEDAAFFAPLIDRKEVLMPALVMPPDHPGYDTAIPVHQTQLSVLYIEPSMLLPTSESHDNSSMKTGNSRDLTDEFNARMRSGNRV